MFICVQAARIIRVFDIHGFILVSHGEHEYDIRGHGRSYRAGPYRVARVVTLTRPTILTQGLTNEGP